MPRPRHPKPDANQAEIIRQLENFGFVVCDVSSLPVAKAGCDIYVYGMSWNTGRIELHAFEIKTDDEQLNENERKFFARVQCLDFGNTCDVLHVARCVEDVLIIFGRVSGK